MDLQGRQIRSCAELSPGDRIEAFHGERPLHRGRVLAVVPELDMFWILDSRTGTRQLLDLDQLRVLRCPLRLLPSTPDRDPGPAAA
ncbi:hypothetical protein [Arthrobacter sp. ZGTC131]|uniref:hypothetical protein n=1 Tax=Arthrobacter sp. ZGTC131 TaxID=2058898 RepID=UPI0015E2FE78|nr:hypothetical protein [Arthrobacter sp. ZGTC131]